MRGARLGGVLFVALLSAGCSMLGGSKERVRLEKLAVLPLERASRSSAADAEAEERNLPPEAAEAVTASIYGLLADQSEFRFAPDLTVRAVLDGTRLRATEGLTARAVALGKEVGADGVIFGRVFRFRERVGTRMGAREPASVSFELGLVEVATAEVIWQGQFERTQQSLSGNLLDFWMFWRAGPYWFTARELAGLGVERLFEEMTAVVAP